MRRLKFFAVVFVCWMISSAASAASVIDGIVVNSQTGQPIAGVEMSLNISGRQVSMGAPTAADGRFSLNPEALYSAEELDTWSLALTFAAKDYVERIQVNRTRVRGEFKITGLNVKLVPIGGVGELPAALKAKLLALRSNDGKALFVVPYSISQEVQDRLPANFMKILNFNIRRGISTHLQSLELDEIPEDISIQALPIELDQANAEKLRIIGTELNALALVGGLGAAGQDEGTQSVTQLSSEYIIIPKLNGFNPGTLYIDDRLLGNPLNATTLYKGMDVLWGRNTVLAISALETRQGLLLKDTAKLDLARSYLVAERSEIGSDNTLLLRKINKLIAFIDDNTARLAAGGTQ